MRHNFVTFTVTIFWPPRWGVWHDLAGFGCELGWVAFLCAYYLGPVEPPDDDEAA